MDWLITAILTPFFFFAYLIYLLLNGDEEMEFVQPKRGFKQSSFPKQKFKIWDSKTQKFYVEKVPPYPGEETN